MRIDKKLMRRCVTRALHGLRLKRTSGAHSFFSEKKNRDKLKYYFP